MPSFCTFAIFSVVRIEQLEHSYFFCLTTAKNAKEQDLGVLTAKKIAKEQDLGVLTTEKIAKEQDLGVLTTAKNAKVQNLGVLTIAKNAKEQVSDCFVSKVIAAAMAELQLSARQTLYEAINALLYRMIFYISMLSGK